MTDPERPGEIKGRPPTLNTTAQYAASQNQGSKGRGLALLIGGLLVVVLIVGLVVYSLRETGAGRDEAEINVKLPEVPELPVPPQMPDVPQIEPPTLPQPNPAPSN